MDRVHLLIIAIILLKTFGLSATRNVDECPKFCICDTWFNLRRAVCTNQRLYSIHTGVSHRVQVLDLSDNAINSLGNHEFARMGLTKLKFLNLSRNGINRIDIEGFGDLKDLVVLDLSMNHLDYLNEDTFLYNTNLRILHLSGNKFNLGVPKLSSVSITELSLSACRINHVPLYIFNNISQLQKLDLSHNFLIELSLDILRRLSSLENISLHANMWKCNAKNDTVIISLQAYFRKEMIKYTLCNAEDENAEKFQKLIVPQVLPKFYPITTDSSKDAWETTDPTTIIPVETEIVTNTSKTVAKSFSNTFAETIGNVPYYWYLLIGTLFGSGATMIVMYVWLSTTIACMVPRLRRRTRVVSQRAALLQRLLSHDGNVDDITTEQSLSCPGTPPPPYREVMLHRGLYPRVHTAGRPVEAEASAS